MKAIFIILILIFSVPAFADTDCSNGGDNDFDKSVCANQEKEEELLLLNMKIFGFIVNMKDNYTCPATSYMKAFVGYQNSILRSLYAKCEFENFCEVVQYPDADQTACGYNFTGINTCKYDAVSMLLEEIKKMRLSNYGCDIPAIEELQKIGVFKGVGPGFDCKLAKTEDEIIICKDEMLSVLDLYLSEIYKEELNNVKDKEEFKLAQKNFIKFRNCGLAVEEDNRGCIENKYKERIFGIEKRPYVFE